MCWLTAAPGPDRRQSSACRHQVNKQQTSLQTSDGQQTNSDRKSRNKRQRSAGPGSIHNHRIPQQSQRNPKHICSMSGTEGRSSHGSLGAVIIIYRRALCLFGFINDKEPTRARGLRRLLWSVMSDQTTLA